ncbi:MAG: MATE family efflux transporter [Solobacterium sp.]|nr:MATE family efflux transporter [Solobacterium sp.]
MQSKQTPDLVNGPLLYNMIMFAIPLMLATALQMCFNAADTIVVGKFAGQQALAGVGATGSLIFLLTSLFNGLSIGTNVMAARYIGAQDHEMLSKTVHTAYCMAAAGGLFLTTLGSFASRPLLELMNTPASIIDLSERYMRIYFLGSLPMLTYNFGAVILRSKGDTRRPLVFLAISGVVNVILNLIFVIAFHMSTAGVATATVISQVLAAFMVTYVLMHEDDATRLMLSQLKPEMELVKEILRIGIPAGISGMMFSISNVVVQSSLNSFNSSVIVAGNSAAANIENFVYIGMGAFSQASITFVSQSMGAERYDNLLRIVKMTLLLSMSSAFLLSSLARFNGNVLLGLYTDDPAVIEAGIVRLKYVAFWLMLNASLDVFVNAVRGMGNSTMPTVIMMIGICGVRLLWLWTVFPMHRTLEMIYICFPISWTVTTILEGLLWYHDYKNLMSFQTA